MYSGHWIGRAYATPNASGRVMPRACVPRPSAVASSFPQSCHSSRNLTVLPYRFYGNLAGFQLYSDQA